MARSRILPPNEVLLAEMRQHGVSGADIARRYGVHHAAVYKALRKAGYSAADWRQKLPEAEGGPAQDPVAGSKVVDLASAKRVLQAMKAVLTRDFSRVTNADLEHAVNAGWLPKRWLDDPLGLREG